ncbi:Maf family protein [Thiobacter aerophilum]|uniref:7-methyl-GTP pyrophosphatase n=1 Tax=Thiobacter aerophilum TaxID=3121275 RepID=A0ABV0EC67_9BURK
MRLVLASSSPYRRQLLARLMLPFDVMSPDVDETPLAGEKPWDTALRLAKLKAEAVARRHPAALIIGSDQVAVLDEAPLGKPGSFENAKKQLLAASGREVVFHTALALLNAATGRIQARVVPFTVKFRSLTAAQIERYLEREQPYDCAGSAKSEGLGIVLIERFYGDDPNALVGLPLIALVDMLREEGVSLP